MSVNCYAFINLWVCKASDYLLCKISIYRYWVLTYLLDKIDRKSLDHSMVLRKAAPLEKLLILYDDEWRSRNNKPLGKYPKSVFWFFAKTSEIFSKCPHTPRLPRIFLHILAVSSESPTMCTVACAKYDTSIRR